MSRHYKKYKNLAFQTQPREFQNSSKYTKTDVISYSNNTGNWSKILLSNFSFLILNLEHQRRGEGGCGQLIFCIPVAKGLQYLTECIFWLLLFLNNKFYNWLFLCHTFTFQQRFLAWEQVPFSGARGLAKGMQGEKF